MSQRDVIYKICTRKEWELATDEGEYRGAPIDLQDGFIHLSARHQVKETAAKHFCDMNDLVLVSFDAEQFGDELKWEISRGGDHFPHLYGRLRTDAASEVFDLPLGENGRHLFPEGV